MPPAPASPARADRPVRMFDSPLLERLSMVPWWAVPAVYLPITAALLAFALTAAAVPPGRVAAWFAVGLLVWTLTEYALHRWIFHWRPRRPWGDRLHFLLHGVHHDHPFDHRRLVMPPGASLPLGLVFFALYTALGRALADTSWVCPLLAGQVAGYVHYDLTHYYLHHGRPRSRRYRRLRAHHNAHHHDPRSAGRKFGVTTTLWDRLFNTL